MSRSEAILADVRSRAGWIGALESLRQVILWMSSPVGEDAATQRAKAETLARDRADIQQALQGDSEAYERVVRRYQQLVANHLWRFTHHRTDYEELVHATFVEAFLSLAKFRGHGSFLSWLLTIATRIGYAYWKKQAVIRRRNEVSLLPGEELIDGHAQTNANPAVERLERQLAALPPRDRLVLTLLYIEERTVAETAKMTTWSESMVKVQAFRARAKLKKLMEEAGDE